MKFLSSSLPAQLNQHKHLTLSFFSDLHFIPLATTNPNLSGRSGIVSSACFNRISASLQKLQ